MRDVIRRCRFSPYRRGCGPTFALTIWTTGRRDWRGQAMLGYRLTMTEGKRRSVLFEGEDFAGSPQHADDSDSCVKELMGFLTLRPGDTDADYFSAYTKAQLDYCGAHAELLSYTVEVRFGDCEST